MSLWKIAWRSIQQRSLASALTALSMALGAALVVAVLVILGVIDQSFRRSAQGYDLIVGAKGTRYELVLSTVFHLGRPTASIRYLVYWELVNGRYASDVEAAVPVCLGDTFKGFRVIGTTPDMFDKFEYSYGKQYEFREGGRNFGWGSPFEAVVGATVARRAGLEVGQTFRPVHGDILDREDEHDEFKVVGILQPTGTPNDRAVFVNIEGFYRIHASAFLGADKAGKPAAKAEAHKGHHDEAGAGKDRDHASDEIPMDKKEITAVLVALKSTNIPRRAALPKMLSKDLEVQAIAPSEEVDRLFEGIVGNVRWILLFLAVLVVIVAGIGILVSMYNSMSERRHEIAIMRALGARRVTVMLIVLCESILLALGGGAMGVLLGHGMIGVLGPVIADQVGVVVSPLQFQTSELILIPGLVLLAVVVGYLPAVVAYRTDVAQSLIASP
jgi:putative ABC transport system permease protein